MSNSTPRAALPPLPLPRVLGRETQFGGTKFPIYGYTSAEVEQIRRETVQACADAAWAAAPSDEDACQIAEAVRALLPVKEPKE